MKYFVFLFISLAFACPPDMAYLQSQQTCIDRFEAPNEEGARPLLALTAIEAQKWCEQRGKQLCSDVIWEAACSNDGEDSLFPYGDEYQGGVCNDDKIWRTVNWSLVARFNPMRPDSNPAARDHMLWLNQSEPSGFRPGCKTKNEIYDLTGNAAEWVLNTKKKPSSTDGKIHSVVMKGCYWAKCYQGIKPNCKFTNANHSATFRSYEAGFRCCLFTGSLSRR